MGDPKNEDGVEYASYYQELLFSIGTRFSYENGSVLGGDVGSRLLDSDPYNPRGFINQDSGVPL